MSSTKLKPNQDEPDEQLYLLEVIVDSLDVYKEGILETFQEKTPVQESQGNEDEPQKPKQGPVRVLVKFFDFPTIEIQEREFKENEEQLPPEIKEEEEVKEPSVATEKDRSKSTVQSALRENDPIYKNKKAEEARWKSEGRKQSQAPVAKEFPGPLPPSNKFTSGKSCLFPMVPKEMMDVIRKHPIEVQVHRDATESEPAHLIGKTRMNLGQEFIDAVALATTPTVLPISAFIEDDFEVTNVFGDVTGNLSLLIRLSCFGATIFTQFKYIQGEKGFKFSTSEGVMKSKGEVGTIQKSEPKTEAVTVDERMPYFTGIENLGMYASHTSPADERFKIPVPWRKLNEDPITPQVCGPKRLFKESAAQKAKKDCPLYDFDQMFPSVGQSSLGGSAGRSFYPGQPMISGNIFEGACCRGQELPSTMYVPPEFGSSMPSDIKRLLPGQRGTGRGALDIPPGTKFACQFGADWVSEVQRCACSTKSRKNRGGGCCMNQAQMVPCPNIPNTRSGGSNWGGNLESQQSYVCSNTQMDGSRDYPPIEQAPPHLRSAFLGSTQEYSGGKIEKAPQQSGGIVRPDVRYVPCPNSPDTRTTGNVVCGLEALADPNQRNLQNLLQPTLMAPKCPPDSSRNMPSLCTCPKVPTVIPPPVQNSVLRCECSNILTALKPIDMPYSCPPPEQQSMMQPGASSSCPPCPPVPIRLPPPSPECPLAKLLKEAQNESKDPSRGGITKQDSPGRSPDPPVFRSAKPDKESPDRTGGHTERQKSATFLGSEMNPKSGVTTDETTPEVKTKKHGTKDKVNKILQEEVSTAQTTTPTNAPETYNRDVEEKTSKTTSLTSDMTPTSKKRKGARRADGKLKDQVQHPPDSQDKELNIAYTPTAGIYPGMVIGHKNCVPVIRLVPKRMGWLWNIKDADGFMKPGRGWRPGSIQTNVMKVMDNVKTTTNKQSKDKKAVKATRSDHHPRKAESGRLLATGGGDAPMFLPIDLTPTLHLHKKHGQYYVSMCPPKERRKRQRPKNTMNAKGELVEESASGEESRPAQFRIDPKNPDGLNLNRELYETDSTSSNTEDSYQMELVAPSTLRNRQPQPIKVDTEIQCTEDDFAAPVEVGRFADKTRKSIVSKKSVMSKKSAGKKKKSRISK
ncbi:hypothetical protein GE061_019772 [Apolygus lucorum]|uniref:Uncharacterized protein n=1 Tax=Apolygus lucorum TaxID=248454 RepID=A0A6A4JHT6_APOLU|nr:hypothetical protein GE061_019772 [Apolygus lucorum]